MQRSGGADDDGVDGLVSKNRVDVLGVGCAVFSGEFLGGVAEGVSNQGQLGVRVGGDGLSVDVANTAGTDDGNV